MPEQSLSQKTVFITGGAKRLGAAMARGFHRHGANIVLHYRQSARQANELAAELQAHRPGSVCLLQADLLQHEALDPLAEAAAGAFGGVDVLVNNASSFYPTPVGSITAQQWDDLVGSNLRAPLFLTQALAPALARAGGLVINMLDINARRPLRGHPVYCAAKAGLAMLTQSLAKELAPAVRVNAIAPGAILWPEAPLPDGAREKILAEIALGRSGCTGDIVQAALYLALHAPYVTGQTLTIDGGRSLGW